MADESVNESSPRTPALRHITTVLMNDVRRRENSTSSVLAVVLLLGFPLVLDTFHLNLVGKYLTYAFVALGLVLCWGYGGILSLGQGVFFGLGGYCMAMFLKLEASDPISTSIQSTPGIPDFMDWNQLTALPKFWIPFKSLAFTVIAIPLVPSLLAFVLGAAMFKRRVGGVYFAIITQAVAAILSILIIGQQGYTGGVNGITDLKTLHGWDIRSDGARMILYFVNAALLLGAIALSFSIVRSKLGRLLLAVRDREERVLFTGYDVANIKTFVFVLAAVFSAIGGAMFTLQVGFMSPSFVGIVPSIEMVIAAAVGGRTSLLGAVYGTLIVNFAKTYFSESFPELWLFLLGAMFIGVVMVFPNGLAGIDLSKAARSALTRASGSRRKPQARWSRRATFQPAQIDAAARERTSDRTRGGQSTPPVRHGARGAESAPPRDDRSERLVRRVQGGRRSVVLRRYGRGARHHRPQRRRQDDAPRPHHGQDAGVQGPRAIQGARAHGNARIPDRPRRGRSQVPDAVGLRIAHGVREPRDGVPRQPLLVVGVAFPADARRSSRRSKRSPSSFTSKTA